MRCTIASCRCLPTKPAAPVMRMMRGTIMQNVSRIDGTATVAGAFGTGTGRRLLLVGRPRHAPEQPPAGSQAGKKEDGAQNPGYFDQAAGGERYQQQPYAQCLP